MAMIKYHNQKQQKEKRLYSSLYSRGIKSIKEKVPHVGSRKLASHVHMQQREKETQKVGGCFKPSKPVLSDILPPARLYLITPPKECL